MRFVIVRLIWLRELRDQFRDRRTVFMVLVLPVLLYPVLGIVLVQFALGFMDQPTAVGIQGLSNLPIQDPSSAGLSPLPAVAWCSALGGGFANVSGAAGFYQAVQNSLSDPPLVISDADNAWHFPAAYVDEASLHTQLPIRPVSPEYADSDLAARMIDVLLIVPRDFRERLARGQQIVVEVHTRPGDELSQLAEARFQRVLNAWKLVLAQTRLRRSGLPANYDEPVVFLNPARTRPAVEIATEGVHAQVVRLIPFLLVVWSLAGALYPAIDVCAGEKERGTMETLLISPASREEIVFGKFLTIWLFSALATLWNLACMGVTAWALGHHVSQLLGHSPEAAACWCLVSILPLTAFFSAVCLAVGVYARSSKEGQYYLMPLFALTMPLVFVTLAPGVELNTFYSLIPVSGVALLMQRLLTNPAVIPWLYAVPVLTAVTLYSLLALRWAIEQFQREEVLFREAQRLDVGLWLRRLVRERSGMPSVGQALACFCLVFLERWLFLEMAAEPLSLGSLVTSYVALVCVPLFMALLLSERPFRRVGLTGAQLDVLLKAALLAVMLLPPLVELGRAIHHHFHQLEQLLAEQQPLLSTSLGQGHGGSGTALTWAAALGVTLLAVFCEEVVFRGYILSGLRHYFSPRSAILFSSFLFALYEMNAFRFVPAFAAGVVLGLLTVRSGSIWPAVLVHFLVSVPPVLTPLLDHMGYWGPVSVWRAALRPLLVLMCSLFAAVLLLRLSRRPLDRKPVTVVPTSVAEPRATPTVAHVSD